MKARVNWVENAMFVAESDSGHAIVLDGAAEGGGRNMGMRPMELMALSVGSCSSYDVVTILKKATRDDAVIVVQSFSKTYSMTGWRLGWLISRRDKISMARVRRDFSGFI